jgi:hypothetical protein
VQVIVQVTPQLENVLVACGIAPLNHVDRRRELDKAQWSRAQSGDVEVEDFRRDDGVVDDGNEPGVREGVREEADVPSPQPKLTIGLVGRRTLRWNKARNDERKADKVPLQVSRSIEPTR